MIKELLDLQKIDSQIDKIKNELDSLPVRKEIAWLLDQLNKDKNNFKTLEAELKNLELAQDKAEGELSLLEEKIAKESEKMYSGKVTNPKELAGIQTELKQLSEKKEMMENVVLEKMEKTAGVSKDKIDLEDRISKTDKELNILEDKHENESANIDKKIKELEISRNSQAEKIDKDLLEEYEDLREKSQGIAIAELTDGVCQACHVELPAVEVDKMRPEEKNYCPFCGRMLKY